MEVLLVEEVIIVEKGKGLHALLLLCIPYQCRGQLYNMHFQSSIKSTWFKIKRVPKMQLKHNNSCLANK